MHLGYLPDETTKLLLACRGICWPSVSCSTATSGPFQSSYWYHILFHQAVHRDAHLGAHISAAYHQPQPSLYAGFVTPWSARYITLKQEKLYLHSGLLSTRLVVPDGSRPSNYCFWGWEHLLPLPGACHAWLYKTYAASDVSHRIMPKIPFDELNSIWCIAP